MGCRVSNTPALSPTTDINNDADDDDKGNGEHYCYVDGGLAISILW